MSSGRRQQLQKNRPFKLFSTQKIEMSRDNSASCVRLRATSKMSSHNEVQNVFTISRRSDTPNVGTKDGRNKKNKNWPEKLDYVFTTIRYSIGLGNVWRFPYMCYKHGGGAFLVPYFFLLFAAALPILILELGLAQFTSKRCLGVWDLAPLFRGVGVSMLVLSGMVVLYYNMVIAYSIFYFFASFTSKLPWSDCNHWWNTAKCQVGKGNGIIVPNATSYRPAEEFWDKYVLSRSSGLHDMGPLHWQLFLCLLMVWILVGLWLNKPERITEKLVYFSATFPYVVLFILFIRGITLPGAGKGIEFFLKPRFDKLGNTKVWKDAAVQIFYSLGPAWGRIHVMASKNKFNNNFQRDGILIVLINCATSMVAGFVVFSSVGFMSYDSGVPISRVTVNGPGLAFVAYPEALAQMPGAPFWSLLFFFMFITLGLETMYVLMSTLVAVIVDVLHLYYPDADILMQTRVNTGLSCVAGFILGFFYTTDGGIYLLTLLDEFSAGFTLLLIALTESLVISYVYGINRFIDDMYFMLKFRLFIYWKICWMAICPAVVILIILVSTIGYSPLTYADYTYPPWAEFMGASMVIGTLLPIPGYMIYFLYWKASGETFKERLLDSIQPTDTWGPALNKHRLEAKYPPLTESQTVRYAHNVMDSKKGRSNKAFDASGDFSTGYPVCYRTKYIVEPSVLGKDTRETGVVGWTRGGDVPLPYSFETSI